MSRQEVYERMVRRTAEPVSAALHARGFFGLFGVDVLVDCGGRQFIVDINPRILGSTPLVFTQRGLAKIGRFWEVGIFLMKVMVKADSPDAVVDCAEAIEGGEVIVYSLIDEGGGVFRCQIAVFAPSIAECRAIAEDFCLEVMSDNALGGFHCR